MKIDRSSQFTAPCADALPANQSPAFEDVDLFTLDAPLGQALAHAGVDAAAAGLAAFGADWGSAETMALGRLANENPPKLRIVDARGARIDQVEFHPAYHALMRKSMAAGLHVSGWQTPAAGAHPRPGAVAERAARTFIVYQVEAGHMCPITMTNAAVAPLAADAELVQAWFPRIAARTYDPAAKPWWEKQSATLGMGMTERQGGTDVRANTTKASRIGDAYEITGQKWFMSAPMCDGFLVLAQAAGGLTCFLMPRYRPDGSLNGLRFQRLKDKLGNRSNASSEVDFQAAYAQRLGEEGAGVRTIIEMVQWTRLDCAVASAGLMRFGLASAVHHARHRTVFQRKLVDQPAMAAVLADLALEVEGATAAVIRLASAFERAAADPAEAAFARLLTPALKYLVCKTAPGFVYEALECLGGNGYVEDLPLARLYREAPLNAIWEGSGNVMALDVLRVARRDPDIAEAAIDRLAAAAGGAGARVAALIRTDLAGRDAERQARRITERLARLAIMAALGELNSSFTELYAQTRLGAEAHGLYGTADLGRATSPLIDRVLG